MTMAMIVHTVKVKKVIKMIKTDYHCHILPAFDDGAKNIEISNQMLDRMQEHGIENIVLTPHFYPHREKSVSGFLERREEAFRKIQNKNFRFYPAAEISVERGISELKNIEKLAVQNTNLILLELPFNNTGRWVIDEIHNIVCDTGLKPILAHIHRYTGFFSKSNFNDIININAVMQINAELLETFSGRRFLNNLIKSQKEIVFGSDAHNISDRKPDYRLIKRYIKKEVLKQSDEIIKKYEK